MNGNGPRPMVLPIGTVVTVVDNATGRAHPATVVDYAPGAVIVRYDEAPDTFVRLPLDQIELR